MDKRRSIIVVSNRGPVTFRNGPDGTRETMRGGGGLVTALSNLAAHHRITWIASAMSDVDRAVALESGSEGVVESTHTGETYRLRLIAHDEEAFDLHYNVVSNPTLWFLQHYLWDLVHNPSHGRDGLERAWRDGYVPVNAAFAEAILEELESDPEAIVFFNDYHLYLAPRFVRDRAPKARLLHFVHIPWAQSDYWHVLPAEMRIAIHEGLLANDLVGFHTPRWQRNFLEAAVRIAGAECSGEATLSHAGRSVRVGARAISVDPVEFEELSDHPDVLEHERRFAASRAEFLVVRVDRTDPSKNILRGFDAFELFLEMHPELQERVTMLALLEPSRQDIPEYADYLSAIELAVRRVNERFERPGWKPIDMRLHDDFRESVAAYKQYDAMLVNPIYDGLNLVAKEAPLVNERDGVLILSENAGAYEEFGASSLGVNPFDVRAQAEAIFEALTMPAGERRRRLAEIRSQVHEHDLAWWIAAELGDLDGCTSSE